MADNDVFFELEVKYTEAEIREKAEDYGVDPDEGLVNLSRCSEAIEDAVTGWLQEQIQSGIEGDYR